MKGPEDMRTQSKIEKELYPLLKPVFHLRPYSNSKDIQMVVFQYADCSSKESFTNKQAGQRCTPQLLTDLTAKVSSHIVGKQCIASS